MLDFIPPRLVRYDLTAQLDGRTSTDFYSFDWTHEVTVGRGRLVEYPTPFPGTVDGAAVMGAIGVIPDRASRSPLWARGEVTLTDPWGRVVEVMDAK